MGASGPVPKRSSQQLGHKTKAEKAEVEHVEVFGEVKIPPADRKWHQLAKDWYNSLAESGQKKFFEPSDWAAAQVLASEMSRMLNGHMSATMFAAVWQAMGDLLTTEGERRRVKVEIDRKPAKPDTRPLASVSFIDRHGDL